MSYSKLWHLADESFIFSVSPALGKMPGPIAICTWVRNCRRRTAPFLDFFLTPVVLGRTVFPWIWWKSSCTTRSTRKDGSPTSIATGFRGRVE